MLTQKMGRANVQVLTIISVLLFLLRHGWAFKVFQKSVKSQSSAPVEFAFAKHFQSHMVLQQAPAKANIYGFSPDIGQLVTLQVLPSIEPLVYETRVKQGPEPGVGVWHFTIDAIKGNITVSIKVDSGPLSLTLTDVLFGDVWICSGQSNMEFTVAQMLDAQEELDDVHNYPNIRIMTVENVQSFTPLYDLSKIRQAWTAPRKATVGGPAWQYFSAVCWLYGKAIHKALGYPIGLVATDWGGTPVEAWSSPLALTICGINKSPHSSLYVRKSNDLSHARLEGPGNNSVLWNAMIYPLLGMTIKGAIWYQGENDASGAMMTHYNCTFPTMIKDWRLNFHNASNGQTDAVFPFGFVQLAPNRPGQGNIVGFPDIRWHQTADHGYVPNTDMVNVFMAVTIDLPDFNSSYGAIHPRDKKDVGDRLALSGLAVAYGRNEVFQGPFPERGEFISGGLIVSYNKHSHLNIRNKNGFEFLCVGAASNSWVPTSIRASKQTSVTLQVTCEPDQKIQGLRYAWRESPCDFKKCAVYETVNGLPAPPFISSTDYETGNPHFQFVRKPSEELKQHLL